jgi:DNA invertase Pin-like site-specific DNA recombinase
LAAINVGVGLFNMMETVACVFQQTEGSGEMAIFGYARVSTTEQTNENQRLELERAGYLVEYWFADTTSGAAHATQRAQFGKLFDKLRKGDTLVVSKLDRLGRDAPDVLATTKSLAALGVEVVVLQLGKLDLASPAGKLMLTMLAAVAEMERDLLVEWRAPGRRAGRLAGLAKRIRSSAQPWWQPISAAKASVPWRGYTRYLGRLCWLP